MEVIKKVNALLDEAVNLIKQLKQLSATDFAILYDKATTIISLLEAKP